VITGFPEDYDSWTKPLLNDLAKHEPSTPIAYEESIRGEGSWSADLNRGASGFEGEWLVFLNNDSKCTSPFSEALYKLPRGALYGTKLKHRMDITWLEGSCLIASKYVWDTVGPFDEALKSAIYTDVDYCIRARLAGIRLAEIAEFPVTHLYHSPQYSVEGVWDVAVENQEHMKKKHSLPDKWGFYG